MFKWKNLNWIAGSMVILTVLLLSFAVTAEKKITLEMWEGPPRAGMYEGINLIIDRFKEKHPNVDIKITQVPWAKFAEKWQTGAMSGVLPDWSDVYASLPQSLYGQGLTVPLDDVVNKIGRDKFSEWTLKVMMMDGHIIGIPYINPPHVLWYRKDWLANKGLKAPTTWGEWLNAAEKLTEDLNGDGKIDRYGNLQYLYDTEPQALTNLMYTCGASTFDKDGKVSINSPAMEAAVEFLKKLWKFSQPGAATQTQNDARILFMADGGAMIATSVSLAAVMDEQAPEKRDKVGVALIPRWEKYDGNWTGCAAYNWWVVSKSTKHLDLVKNWLLTFFDPENYLEYSQTTYIGWLPVLTNVQRDPRFLNHPRMAPYKDYFKVALQASPGSISFGQEYGSNKFGGMVDAEGVYKGIIERAVLKNEPTKEILKWAEKKVKEIVETYR